MRERCLSLWQPWASLVVLGHKRIETRSWPTKHRGPLWIHAADQRLTNKIAIDDHVFAWMLKACGVARWLDLPRGAVIGRVSVVDVRQVRREVTGTGMLFDEGTMVAPPQPELTLGDYTPGRFGWMLADAIAIDPIPAIGRQRIFHIDAPQVVP